MKIGVLGAGQLGRMLALAGYPLGLRFRFFDPDAAAPAGQLAELQCGAYEDAVALERFAAGLDVITFEFESVPAAAAERLADRVPVYPPPQALAAAQDRLAEKRLFGQLGIATPAFAPINDARELDAAVARLGLPAVLKTRRLGYDGKGQVVLRRPDDCRDAWQRLGGTSLILEQWVHCDRELSLLAVRARNGQTAYYPLVENRHHEGILRVSLAPAPGLVAELQSGAEQCAERILTALDYVGVLAIEFFQVDGHLLANELAPRVHNSGHWTIEGAATSQFENHLRAILGYPLGATDVRGSAAMVNLIGNVPAVADLARVPGAHLHLYGKAPAPNRKLGHVTLCGSDGAAIFADPLVKLLRLATAHS